MPHPVRLPRHIQFGSLLDRYVAKGRAQRLYGALVIGDRLHPLTFSLEMHVGRYQFPHPSFNLFTRGYGQDQLEDSYPACLPKREHAALEPDSFYNSYLVTRIRGAEVAYKTVHSLRDQYLSNAGDLGWTLAYATAFGYRHMSRNRIGITSAINHARRAEPSKISPFLMFDMIDRNVFASKLHEMVYLCWQRREVDHPGVTYSPGKKAARICIQLNSTPFDDEADINILIRMLIHHMIHAFFLACCGAPKQGDKLDGRLLDGVHFGVLLSSINDITQECEHGSLDLQFHAHSRQQSGRQSTTRTRPFRPTFIALDPTANIAMAPPFEGHSCCQLDNRSTTLAQIFNWQVEEYSRAINDNWESRGDEILIPRKDSGFRQVKRVKGPPSATYNEIIWNSKRIIVPRELFKKYSTLSRMGYENKFGDAKLPDCTKEVLFCLLQLVHYDAYLSNASRTSYSQQTHAFGPPVLLSPHSSQGESILLHVRVCKLADSMRFPELRQEALRHLYEAQWTSDDPVVLLRLIYDDDSIALSSELQTWSRRFLARLDGDDRATRQSRGVSNYEKMLSWHSGRILGLYHKHAALRDDCKLAVATLSSGFVWDPNEPELTVPQPRGSADGLCWRGQTGSSWMH